MFEQFRIADEQLYYHVKPQELAFNTTKDISPENKVFGHDTARDALQFAIDCPAKGFNAYVRGVSGSGRKTLVRQVLTDSKPQARQQKDYCYVHNFSHPNNPRLIVLQRGYGKMFKQFMSMFCDYVINDLPDTLNSEDIRTQRKAIEAKTNQAVAALYEPLETALQKSGMALANVKEGNVTRMIIAPVHEGRVIAPEEANQLIQQGVFSEAQVKAFQENLPAFQEQLTDITAQAAKLTHSGYDAVREIDEVFARKQLSRHLDAISKKFNHQGIDEYLDEITEDFIANALYNTAEDFDPIWLYGVNILSETHENDEAPIVFEHAPSLSNLLGAVETEGKLPPYASISGGSLLKADGGFLVMEVDEALAESGTWSMLMRTLRSGKVSFAFEDKVGGRPAMVQPDAIPLDVKIILIGSHRRFYELGAYEGDFLDNFKVLVDLETELPRRAESYMQYAHVISKVVNDENLLHFERDAVAKLIEHGIRISGGKDKLSLRFGHIMDTAREAAYLAKKADAKLVQREHVIAALAARRRRNYAPAKRFYEMLDNGTIIVETVGERVGQINGLAVSQAGRLSYGFPSRITTTLAPGEAGLINVEGKADLSGNIHTKGFQILGGLLRHLLKPERPLSFSASVAFEQSYGGIDGDSASGAEACCLLSALTNTPIKQSLSMTGAIDQFGQIQAIGGVNEKIEGFFDCCAQAGLNGEQGVIIPVANVADLMLRDEVVAACEAGQFHIYAVTHVLDALAILTDTTSCREDLLQCRPYQAGSLLAQAVVRADALSQQSGS